MNFARSSTGIVLGLACLLAAGHGAHADPEADGITTAEIEAIYLFNEWLNPFDINTTTQDGVVTLEGSVEDLVERRLAERIALSVDGVTLVKNELEIDPDGKSTVVEDREEWVEKREALRDRVTAANLEAAVVRHLLYAGAFANAADVTVEVDPDNFEATLDGSVTDEAARLRAERIALATLGVTGVENNLDVVDDDPAQQADAGNTLLEDGWIETKVQGQIAFNEHLNLGNFDVEVTDGVCTLTGEVISKEQKMLAADLARETEGVKSVNNLVTVVAWNTAALE